MHEKLIDRLGNFIELERELRNAHSSKEMEFVACNLSKRVLNYETAIFLNRIRGQWRVSTVSGTSDFESTAPIVLLAEAVLKSRSPVSSVVTIVAADTVDEATKDKFAALNLLELSVVSLNSSMHPNSASHPAAIVFLRDKPWQSHEQKLLEQLTEVIEHSRKALSAQRKRSVSESFWRLGRPGKRWVVAALLLLAFLPIRQSIIAQGEITARSPSIVSTSVEGVIKEVLVRPNQQVKAGQVLVRLDSADYEHNKNTTVKELDLANERLRKAMQEALGRQSTKNVIAELQSEVLLKKLELDYLEEVGARMELTASRDGIVLFTSQKDWIGRAINAGEKIMELAASDDQQFEIWVAANDAIELNEHSPVKFFPDANPLDSVKGSVDTVSFFASKSGDGVMSYRVLGSIGDSLESTRLGMKGTARIYGEKVSLAYFLFRKPLSAVRQTAGI